MYVKTLKKEVQGSITVEAAIIVPIVLLCIFWLTQQGIALYEDTVTIVGKQEMWDEFEPAAKFRNLELLDQALKK